MYTFLFDKYGYYPPELKDNAFIYKNWIFKIIETDYDDQEIEAMAQFCLQMAPKIANKAVHIIKNRFGYVSSNSPIGKIVLISYPMDTIEIKEILYMHQLFRNIKKEEQVKLSDLIKVWEEKIEFLETKCIPSFRFDDSLYIDILESTYFAIGLAENALQYLADAKIDYGDQISNTTIAHKRINILDYESIYSPFNLIIDHPVRDLAEMYKSDIISFNDLINILPTYKLTPHEASLLMARILFPTRAFDILEDHFIKKIDVRVRVVKYRQSIQRDLSKIKNIHLYLIRVYGIRPIKWL